MAVSLLLLGTNAIASNKDSTASDFFFRTYVSTISSSPVSQCLKDNSYTFTSGSTISSGSITTYFWRFGDGNTDAGTSVTHSYASAGTFNVTLIVTSDNGCMDSVTHTVTVFPQPKAIFIAPALQCLTDNNFTFNSTSTISAGTIASQTWKFGDGNTGTGISSSHSYAASGSYNVSLIVTSDNGCIDSVAQPIAINPKPAAIFNEPSAQCLTGNSFNFISNASISAGAISSQLWNFGDGNTATGTNVTHSYTEEGSYIVTLIVSSDNGCADSIKHTITVYPKPKAIFTDPIAQCLFGNKFKFNSNSIINTGSISSYNWNFGDGTKSDAVVAVHSYLKAGNYPVSLIISSDNGCSDSMQQIVSIRSTPHSSFNDPPPQCLNGNNFNFNNNASIDAGIIAGSTWNFGDGNSGIGTTASHSYKESGSYLVQLISFSDFGCADTSTKSITVYPQPVSNFIASKDQLLINDQIDFQSNVSISSGSINSFLWFFGDGNSASGIKTSHAYLKAGTFPVTLIAGSNFGCYDTINKTIHVIDQITTTSFVVPQAQCLTGNNFNFVSTTNVSAGSIISHQGEFGDGTKGTGINVQHSYTSAGSYLVKLVTTTNTGLRDSVTHTITVHPPSNTIANAGPDQLICNLNTSTALSANNPDIGKGVWRLLNGPSEISFTDATLYNTNVNGLVPGTYQLAWTINNGVCPSSTSNLKIVVDKMKVDFGLNAINECGSTTYQFTDDSKVFYGIANWKWSSAPGDTISTKFFTKKYTQAGENKVSLTLQSNSGCSVTTDASFQVKIFNMPKASINAISEACKDQLLQLSSTLNSRDSIFSILWNLGNGINTKDSMVSVQYYSEGKYTVKLLVSTINKCYDSSYKQITIHPLPVIVVPTESLVCKGDSIKLIATGATTYIWKDKRNNIICNSCETLNILPTANSNYSVIGYDQYGCSQIANTTVKIVQPIKLEAVQMDTICIGSSIKINVTGADNYLWKPDAGLSNYNSGTTIASPKTTTIYTVIGRDNQSCFADTAKIKLVVGNPTKINIGTDTTIQAGVPFRIGAMIYERGIINKWQWSGNATFSCVDCESTIAKLAYDGDIMLTATNIYGCYSRDTVSIKTFCPSTEVFIPNAFSPDGDGINDILYVQGSGIKIIKDFRIYSRWGELVFERTNFLPGDRSNGWDGKIRGKMATQDVFIYVCEVVCEKGVAATFKGNIAVLK